MESFPKDFCASVMVPARDSAVDNMPKDHPLVMELRQKVYGEVTKAVNGFYRAVLLDFEGEMLQPRRHIIAELVEAWPGRVYSYPAENNTWCYRIDQSENRICCRRIAIVLDPSYEEGATIDPKDMKVKFENKVLRY